MTKCYNDQKLPTILACHMLSRGWCKLFLQLHPAPWGRSCNGKHHALWRWWWWWWWWLYASFPKLCSIRDSPLKSMNRFSPFFFFSCSDPEVLLQPTADASTSVLVHSLLIDCCVHARDQREQEGLQSSRWGQRS